MRRLGGQAGRLVWSVLRRLLAFALGSLVVGGAGFAVLAWWLAEHPIEMPWLAARIQTEANGVRVGGAVLAWEGFRQGLGSPIDIRLQDVALNLPAQGVAVSAPLMQVVLDLGPLLHGAVRPRSIAIRDARIVVQPNAMASRSLGAGVSGPGPFDRLRRVVVTGTHIEPADHRLWEIRRLDAELDRAAGPTEASGHMELVLADASATVTLQATAPEGGDATLRLAVGALPSSALAELWPAAKDAASVFTAPIATEAELDAGADLVPKAARLVLSAGAGTLTTGNVPVPVLHATARFAWNPGLVAMEEAELALRPRPDRPPTRLAAHGTARLGSDGVVGQAVLDLDRLAFDDLAAIWPKTPGDDGRDWVVSNITAGVAHDGHVALGFAAASGGAPRLTGASGTVAGSGLTVHWLRPMAPIEHGEATLRIIDPDSLRVDIAGGQQPGGLTVQGGSVSVSGLTQREQFGAIRVLVAGAVPDALALLAHPRLHLLSAHPVPLKDPTGRVTANVAVRLPLLARVTMDQVALETRARLTGVHVSDVVADRALDDGAFDLAADADQLTIAGSARLANIPARITGALDFRAGAPDQVQERFTVSGQTQASALGAAGLDASAVLSGPTELAATYAHRRNGASDIDVSAGLGQAELRVTQLGWRKPAGDPATARATIALDAADRLSRIEAIDVEGEGIVVRGRATLDPHNGIGIELDRLVLGRSSAQGTIRILDGGKMVRATLTGSRLDASGRFARESGGPHPAPVTQERGPSWLVDARFDSLLLARGRPVSDFHIRADGLGSGVRTARLSGRTGPGQGVEVSITPEPGGRAVRATAADGGALLRDLGAVESIQGGALSVSAHYLDQRPGQPLSGMAELDDFTVRGAPVLAKVLQAVTLYGLVEAVQGSGMRFRHLAAPFTYADGVLALDDARAFNPSLGLTAKGRIDFDRERLDMEGTIVPAYYVNTALGHLPLFGRLFSPEKGGGVFAARYSARGGLDDPAVRVNPLSALTPGFLRGMFGR